jgi:zinc transport system substrate-binding protein
MTAHSRRTAGLAVVLLSLSGVAWSAAKAEVRGPPIVVATIFPDYDFVRAVAGDRMDVRLLLPPGVEAHTYEPTPSDVTLVARAAAFVYTGAHMEPWVEGFLAGIGNRGLLVVDASAGIRLAEGHGEGEEDHADEEDELDPHIWLDPTLAEHMVGTIAEALVALDPGSATTYRANASAYRERLEDLDRRIAGELGPARGKTIVYGGHFAFGYFARRYDLEYVSPYRGFSPDAEPTPRAVAELVEVLKGTGSRVVFYEELLEPRVATAIADATGARLELLHGVHNLSRSELDSGASYLSIMEDNLRKLKEALIGP